MATYYRWRKNKLDYKESSLLVGNNSYVSMLVNKTDPKLYYYQDFEPEIKQDENGYYYDFSGASTDTIKVSESYGIPTYKYYANNSRALSYEKGASYMENDGSFLIFTNPNGSFYYYSITDKAGDFVEYVYSTNPSDYPNGGDKDGFYYDQRTTVTSPTAPAGLTYPNPITTPTVTVSWDAATSNTDYPVDHYSLIYYTNGNVAAISGQITDIQGTSTQLSIPPSVTSIRFAIRAYDTNGQFTDSSTTDWIEVYMSPTLSVPSQLMQGQQATINWSAIEGANSYTLQRKANTDADWTQVYSGANLTFSEAVGTWTTVQYRVQAVFDGTPGGWAESAVIPVVSASSLVISGTDEDLGIVTNDIPYSISTDTGNQITATITVNNAVIFSGNVGNSTADVIPVLDLITGEGTIVISATVDASGSPVTATRTWTYEKAAITFPNSGSVAQVTREGENIYPKVLAEGVRLPGGKTLDQVMGFPCQIYTGSYTGTGTSGASNPITLSFPFEPKIVFIARETTPTGGSLGTITPMIKGVQRSIIKINGSSHSIAYLTWDNNSLSFYGNGGADTSLNESGINYYYVALS